ncbi:PREDICTED: phosphoglycerate mutase-like protein 4 [Brassica oleracea var. oleracea]|uniref:phosphoglycerate mutase-like protein 4 n=1 Tax=Brassica oleracea var. oleracea TaxID=109376 RepID=UPI0006A73F67|nr:PREDICTED: phosphoglycerate mutase-like protein 4 [Brassica oleracea var. oleracea]
MAESSLNSSVDQTYTEIVVVRHGETSWNAERKIQGHIDVELNDAGRQQAVRVAERLSKEPRISYVYSSDLKRAFETAQIIAAKCGNLEVITDPDLRERHLGDMQGLVYQEASKAFLSNRTDVDIPGGGESLDKLYDRCTSALQRIGDKHKGERVVVVTHGGAVRSYTALGVIRSLYERARPKARKVDKILNTSVNVFRLFDGDKWRIHVWGDVTHLDQTGFLKSGFGGDRTSG